MLFMAKYLTEEQVLEELRKRCEDSSQTEVATELGVHKQYVHLTLRSGLLSPKLAEKMGYRIVYERVK